MSHDEFTKLYVYMSGQFAEMNARFDQMVTKKDFDKLVGVVDGLAKQVTNNHQEFLALVSQVGRHDKWIHHLAIHTGTKLP